MGRHPGKWEGGPGFRRTHLRCDPHGHVVFQGPGGLPTCPCLFSLCPANLWGSCWADSPWGHWPAVSVAVMALPWGPSSIRVPRMPWNADSWATWTIVLGLCLELLANLPGDLGPHHNLRTTDWSLSFTENCLEHGNALISLRHLVRKSGLEFGSLAC